MIKIVFCSGKPTGEKAAYSKVEAYLFENDFKYFVLFLIPISYIKMSIKIMTHKILRIKLRKQVKNVK